MVVNPGVVSFLISRQVMGTSQVTGGLE